MVYQDDQFEVDVMGISVAPFDSFGFSNNDELLICSVKSGTAEEDMSIQSFPYIRFDPRDPHDAGSKPDQFIPIPATKAPFMSYDGKKE